MSLLQIAVLAVIQGLAELLPVSSSAHVIIAERLMGLDPTRPELTFLLVMLHTGTMFAVLYHFWPRWRAQFARNRTAIVKTLAIATACTAVVGLGLKTVVEKIFMAGVAHAEIESLFGNLPLIAASLACAGLLIIAAGSYEGRKASKQGAQGISSKSAAVIGIVQGLCLPFRGFSRSGATISTGILCRAPKDDAEDFSFALAVILTPPVVVRELLRLVRGHADVAAGTSSFPAAMFGPGLAGMVLSFVAGVLALRWVSAWLEKGRWMYFGYYCLLGAAAIVVLSHLGY